MMFDYKKYQLNSYRQGLITYNKLFGRPTVLFNCESQHSSIDNIEKYKTLYKKFTHNIICLPFDLSGNETGDNYEIYFYHENKLKTDFYVVEKLGKWHPFFNDFGVPSENFTNYIFDSKLHFIKESTDFNEVLDV